MSNIYNVGQVSLKAKFH